MDSVSKWHNLEAGEYTETGTNNCSSNYNSTTGSHDCDQSNYGANLKIDVWPFTQQNGSTLATDYPYNGGNQYPQTLNPKPPSGLKIMRFE